MTMTRTADIEKALALLRDIADRSCVEDLSDIHTRARLALRALDGEGEEEEVWEAAQVYHPSEKFGWALKSNGRLFAYYVTEANAKRIARLPKLERAERAARKVIDRYYHGEPSNVTRPLDEAFRELDAALNTTEAES